MRVRALTAIAVSALALAACGGQSDEEQVEQVVRDFAEATRESDGERFCGELVTQEYLEQTVGATGDGARRQCVEQIDALSGTEIRLVRIVRTKIDGDRATVTAVLEMQGREEERILRLEKEDGEFRLTTG